MTWEDAVRVALELPAVEISAYHGYPAVRVAGRFLMRLGDDPAAVEFKGLNPDERELLIEARPHVFFAAGVNQPFQARLASIDEATLRGMLENRWRAVAPRALVAARDNPWPIAS